MTPGRLILGLVLVIGGLAALGANLGLFTWADAAQLIRLWPLFLIVAGLNMLLGGRRRTLAVGLSLLILIAGVGFLAVAHDAQWGPFTRAERESTAIEGAPTESFTGGHLIVEAGSLDLDLHGIDSGNMASGEFASHRNPQVSEYTEGGNYRLKVSQTGGTIWLPFRLGELRGDSLTLGLAQEVPWTIDMNLGAADVELDLQEVTLAGLTLNSGASSVNLTVGPTVEDGARVAVKGGAGSYRISLPREADLLVTTDTALTSNKIDPALEKNESGGYSHDGGGPSLHVNIAAGVSSVQVSLY